MEEKLKQLTFGKTILIGLVLTVVYYFALYDDGVALETQINTTRTELETNTKELESLKKAILDAERYKLTMATLGAEMDKVLLAIPAKLTTLDLMKIISTEAKNVGANIVNINSGTSVARGRDEPATFYESVPISISITSSYTQTMLFLSNLTRLDKIVVAKKIKMNASSAANSVSTSPIMSTSIDIEAFKYVSPEAAAGEKK